MKFAFLPSGPTGMESQKIFTLWRLYFCELLILNLIRAETFWGFDASSAFIRRCHPSTAARTFVHQSVSPTGVEWGLHFPAANGEYQSPINLNSREALYDPSLLDVRLSPNYVVCRDCEVINDGHTVRIILRSKSGDCWETRLPFTSFAAPTPEKSLLK